MGVVGLDKNIRFNDVLGSIRRIIRAIDIHSKMLSSSSGITGPQLVVLKEIDYHERITTTRLAEQICLSQSTTTTILDRLEAKQLVIKTRDTDDKRRWHIELSTQGRTLSDGLLFVLPKLFMSSFSGLPDWHQNQIIATLQQTAQMMDGK